VGALGHPLYFNHVPKCAGTFVNELLCRSFHRHQLGVEPFLAANDMYTLDAARLDRLELVGSHFPHWAAARRLPGWSKLTILREPWPRLQSLLRHLLRLGADLGPVSTPVTFLESIRRREFDQAMEQMAIWYPCEASLVSYFVPDPLDQVLPPTALADATKALSGYDAVFLTESLAEDGSLLDRAVNGHHFGVLSRLNTAEHYDDVNRGPFPAEYEKQFHALFPYERKLYEAARDQHERTVATLGKLAPGDCMASTNSPGHDTRAMFAIDWDGPTRCGGFSDRIVAASQGYTGRYARRVEADRGVLEFTVRKICDARLEAVFWITPLPDRRECVITLNGRELRLFDPRNEVQCPSAANQVWSSVTLPASTFGDGTCRLEIQREKAPAIRELWLLDLAVRPVASSP
jgi:Sulfotransferase family